MYISGIDFGACVQSDFWVFAQDIRKGNTLDGTSCQILQWKKGYGFIQTEECGDVYVHKPGIKEFGHFGLQKGDPLSFEVKETSKGKLSINLQPLKLY